MLSVPRRRPLPVLLGAIFLSLFGFPWQALALAPTNDASIRVDALLAALRDRQHPDMRSDAADDLAILATGQIPADTHRRIVVALLTAAMIEPTDTVHANILGSLSRVMNGTEDAGTRNRVISELLSEMNVTRSPAFLRGSAALALGRIKADRPDVIASLITASRENALAVRALGQIGEMTASENRRPRIVAALVQALENQEPEIRSAAIGALSQVGAKSGADTITAVLHSLGWTLKNDPKEENRAAAAGALAWLATAIRKHAEELSSDPNELKKTINTLRAARAAVTGPSDLARDVMRDQIDSALQVLSLVRPPLSVTVFTWLRANKTVAGVALYFVVLSSLWLVLLWLRPLWLMSVNDALRPYTDITLPAWLGGIKLPLRKVLLVGWLDGHPRILDAWVAAHAAVARERFAQKDTVMDREVHVDAPVVMDGKTAPSYGPADLRPAFGRQRVYVLISGEGGSGKTSLACQIAKWAMSADGAERVAAHLVLPVFLDEELPAESEGHEPLLAAIRGGLQDVVDAPEPISEELAERLLRRRRLLVIVDHLSETSAATRQAIQPSLPDFPVNAMVVTSRLDEPLGGVTKTVIRPLRIEGNRLSSFMEAYLMQRGKRELFTDSEYFEACRRLSLIVGARNVTALLAKLYAEQMISLKEEASASGLPDNIPELMLSYLNQVNRGASGDDPNDRTVQCDAKAIAWECLRRTYRPAPAKRDAILAALGGYGAESRLEYLETRLRLIQTVGAARDQIRFALDPLAEYLAALHLLLRQLGDEPNLWRDFLTYADSLPDAPAGIRGFLLATRDCIAVQGREANVPDFVAAELERRTAAIGAASSLSASPPESAAPEGVTRSNPPLAAQEG